jgi:hypothetical protein
MESGRNLKLTMAADYYWYLDRSLKINRFFLKILFMNMLEEL